VEIKSLFSLFNLAKPRPRGDAVAPSTNAEGIKQGGEKLRQLKGSVGTRMTWSENVCR